MSETLSLNLQACMGLCVLIGIGVALSENPRAISPKLLVNALALQVILALMLLKVPPMVTGLGVINRGVLALAAATRQGSSFVYGYIGGGALPFEAIHPANTLVFAFQILPLVLVVSALAAIGWHLKLLPLIINTLGILFHKPLNTRGAAGFAVIANVFVGQVEAPLLVKPHIENMSRYELLLLMTAGMTMIAGTMMVVYSVLLAPSVPNIGVHLIVKSMMSIPAAILFAHLLLPEPTDLRASTATTAPVITRPYHSSLDALTRGTQDGIHIWFATSAMLLVLVSLVALINSALGTLPPVFDAALSLERIAGWIFAPVAYLMGIPWQDSCWALRPS